LEHAFTGLMALCHSSNGVKALKQSKHSKECVNDETKYCKTWNARSSAMWSLCVPAAKRRRDIAAARF